MGRILTKVKSPVKKNREEKLVGWNAVLCDIERDIEELKKLVPIVKRKIEREEPWPLDNKAGTATDAIPA